MEYHHLITISNWNFIKEELKNKLKIIPGKRYLTLSNDMKQWLSEQILPDITAITNKEHKIINAIVFLQEPDDKNTIHVDGMDPNRTGSPHWALNIPLTESNAEMSWYEGNYTLKVDHVQNLAYLDIDWHFGPNLAKTIKIDKPVIVNIDTPHKVVNFSNHVRMILSIRFTPDLYSPRIR